MDSRVIDSGLAYARQALAARMAEPTRDLERDASLALAILALLAASGAKRDSSNVSTLKIAPSQVREEKRVGAYEGEPRIINFERAKARILARRERAAQCVDAVCARPRLRIFRGD